MIANLTAVLSSEEAATSNDINALYDGGGDHVNRVGPFAAPDDDRDVANSATYNISALMLNWTSVALRVTTGAPPTWTSPLASDSTATPWAQDEYDDVTESASSSSSVPSPSPTYASSFKPPSLYDVSAAILGMVPTTYENDTGWVGSTITNDGMDYYFGNDSFDNMSNYRNETPVEMAPPPGTIVMVITSVILGLMILITVIGNVFVIAAILLERNLQSVANYLILSLAVADLMVACLVMPLGAVYEVSKEWILGPELCDMWTSSDVLCCTASILHLVAIAVDRYWAVTYVNYIHQRNSNRIGIMIAIVWVVSLVVSLAPIFGWKDPNFRDRIVDQKKCLISQDIAYQLFATMATFYVPLFAILFLYWRIFLTARRRIRRKGKKPKVKTPMPKCSATSVSVVVASSSAINGNNESTTAFTVSCNNHGAPSGSAVPTAHPSVTMAGGLHSGPTNVSPEKSSSANGSTSQTSHISDMSRMEMLPKKDRKLKESPESKREKKAAKTLAIITGAFVVCWLPFFVVALLLPIYGGDSFNDYVMSFLVWLGYFNSTLNPVLYTIFSPEFRSAFRRILFGRQYRPR